MLNPKPVPTHILSAVLDSAWVNSSKYPSELFICHPYTWIVDDETEYIF